MIIFQLLVYFLSFFIIWYCAGIIIKSVENFSHRLKVSSFSVSFFILGILTSIPELSVGINSIITDTPEIFVGNLLGASLVLFILVIPLLAVFGGGVRMVHQLTEQNMIFALLVIITPVFLIADNVLTRTEGVFLIGVYIILFYFIESNKGLLQAVKEKKTIINKHVFEDMAELILAAIIIFITSRYIVTQTVYFSNYFKFPSFLISLIFLSIGTNLPELSLAFRSILSGKKEVALGDYLGSAASNTLFFGIFTLFNGKRVNVTNYSLKTMFLMLLGLGLFYIFSRSKKDISRREGKILLLVYLLFIILEVFFQ